MSTGTVQAAGNEPAPSPWRLVNLGLGLSALLEFMAATGYIPQLVPTRWIVAPWLTSSAASALPPFIIVLVRVGINLWLPASVFMLLFYAAGFHRKLGAPQFKLASGILMFAWVANIGLALLPLVLGRSQGAYALMVVFGMYLKPVWVILSIAIVIAAAAEIKAMATYGASAPSRAPVTLLLWAVVPPLVSLTPVLLAPGNPVGQSARETRDFATLCKDVGVRLQDKPIAPVRSLAYDWDPQRFKVRPMFERVEMDARGRIQSYGSGFTPMNAGEREKKLSFHFTESRPDRAGAATKKPGAPYYRFPDPASNQPFYGVDSLSADVLAFLDVDKPEELQKAPVSQGAMKITLTLTDRRSGKVLGTQTYVVDAVNKRACGANLGTHISQNAFIYDAINR